jgi:hypothetical protein
MQEEKKTWEPIQLELTIPVPLLEYEPQDPQDIEEERGYYETQIL